MNLAQLTISRTSIKDIQLRQVILTLDDAPLATLKYEQQITRPIEIGTHRLVANNTFQKKAFMFEAKADQHVRFTVINRAGRLSLFLIFVFGAGPMYLTLERQPDLNA